MSYTHTRHPQCLPLRVGRGGEDGWEDLQLVPYPRPVLKLSSPKISQNLIRLHRSLFCWVLFPRGKCGQDAEEEGPVSFPPLPALLLAATSRAKTGM